MKRLIASLALFVAGLALAPSASADLVYQDAKGDSVRLHDTLCENEGARAQLVGHGVPIEVAERAQAATVVVVSREAWRGAHPGCWVLGLNMMSGPMAYSAFPDMGPGVVSTPVDALVEAQPEDNI